MTPGPRCQDPGFGWSAKPRVLTTQAGRSSERIVWQCKRAVSDTRVRMQISIVKHIYQTDIEMSHGAGGPDMKTLTLVLCRNESNDFENPSTRLSSTSAACARTRITLHVQHARKFKYANI